MASKRRLLRLGGGLAAAAVAAAATLVGITLAAGPALAAGTGTGYLRTNGNRIVDSTGATVRITGINWFGMETDNRTFHGLWANPPATWRGQLDRMAELGFNTLRIPYAGDAIRPGATATSINTWTNPDLVGLSPLQILDLVIDYAGGKGMRVILDRHRPSAAGQTALWYTSTVSEASIIADWQMLAQRYAGNTTVIGADLFNEPHAEGTDPNGTGACWGCDVPSRDWRLAAERIGNAILQVNPNWLIFVEGVSCLSGGTANEWDGIPDPWQNCDWWGGNLSAAIDQPVRLNVANRLVYAPHDYAISVFDRQVWFEDPTFPSNLPGVWDHFWGKLAKQNVAPIMLGEFGSTLQNPLDTQWLNTLMSYLTTNGMSFTYWSWNPNSGDTGGIALDDWYSINQTKYNILQPHLVPPVPTGTQPTTTATSQPPQVPGTPGTPTASNIQANTVTFTWAASSGTVTNYQVERCQGGTCTNFTPIGTAGTPQFSDIGLTANTTYRYRVRATNSAGNSPYSGILTVTTTGTTSPPQVPGPPGSPTASGITASSVTVSWTASTGTVTNYLIERCQGATCTNFTQVGTSTTTSFSNTGLTANTTYRYRIRATNSVGNSPYSSIINVTTSNVTTTTTTTSPPGGCSASYRLVNSWDVGFQGEVTVTNTGTTPTSSWTAVVTFGNGQRITQIWGGFTNLSGNSPYTVTPDTWNGALQPSGSTTLGFLASRSGTNNPPMVTCTRTP